MSFIDRFFDVVDDAINGDALNVAFQRFKGLEQDILREQHRLGHHFADSTGFAGAGSCGYDLC